jgi:uncharacterized membrane protein YhdT
MTLISLIITLAIIGFLLWLVNAYLPMDGTIKRIMNIAVAVVVILWLLYAFGILNHAGDIRIPQVR